MVAALEHLVTGEQSGKDLDIFEGIRCIVCGNNDKGQFKVKYCKENCSIVVCQNCSFHFIPPYYRKAVDYTQYKTAAAIQEVAQADVWLKIQRNLLRYRLIRKYQKTGKVYDIGCGFGHFLFTGKQLGYEVSGVEMSKANVEFVRSQFHINVEENNFLNVREDEKYDIVTLWDVLEHIDAADQIIEKVSRILRPGGHVFVQVPQIDSFFATLLREQWWAMGLDHVNYFSRKTIRALFTKHRINVKKIRSSIELKNVFLYAILPRMKRKKKSEISWTVVDRQQEFNKLTRKPMWIRRLLIKVHNIVYKILSFLHVGDEMIVVAQIQC
jgi:2-polyprenyl-3-methyl-5-hydroxy-6-metoxy-1,4-benzoquinol methylase